jgi:hypothetical protein
MNLADQLIQADAMELLQRALSAQGSRALDNPLSAAAVHEAGHAVLYAAHGHDVRSVKVWQKKRGVARGQWIGFTSVDVTLRTGPNTAPEADFIYATIIIAGVLSEQIFDGCNFRQASSLVEVVGRPPRLMRW